MLRRARAGSTLRPGFTLVELLIVIAIIALLAALTTAGVSRVRDMGRRAQAMNDISQLNTATTSFKNAMNNNLPPSWIAMPVTVPPNPGTAPLNTMRDDGYRLLIRMFPRWQIQVGGNVVSAVAAMQNPTMMGQPFVQPGMTTSLQFRGQSINGVILDGNQCMVFFLGGPNQQGFDPSGPYPANPIGKTKKGPWFDFQEGRFIPGPNNVAWYADPWGTPYAFFSCGSGGDSYPSAQFPLPTSMGGPGTWINAKSNTNTYATPYRSGNRWINPGGVQIISAGPNGAARNIPMGFGPGSVTFATPPYANWTPGVGQYTDAMPGGDDVANFNNGTPLGSSGQ